MEFLVGLIFIGLVFLKLRKNKNHELSSKKNRSTRQEKKELKKLEESKINELKNKRAYRKFNVSGVTFEDRQQLLDIIVRRYSSEGTGRIQFIPEPDNKYDPNAIKIIFENVGHIGYVPRERAVNIGKLLDGNTYDIRWDVDYSFNEYDDKDEGVTYMEIRLYQQK